MSADWQDEDTCDAAQSLLRAPERERIVRHATELLSRALNMGRTVAFVGAGASMAYGRISWRDLVLAMQARSQVSESGLQKTRIQGLLHRQKIKAGGAATSEDFLTVFQLAEQAMQDAAEDPPVAKGFREQVSDLIRDDRGHAEQILRDAIQHPDTAAGKVDIQLRPEDEAKPPIHEKDFRRVGFLSNLLANVANGPKLSAEAEKWRKRLTAEVHAFYACRGVEHYLRPYHRFLNGVLLRLMRQEVAKTAAEAAIWVKTPPPRSSLLPLERDPLMIVLRRLGIVRYMTTNYDAEIQVPLRSEGFRREGGRHPGDERRDQLAGAWSEVVFDRNHIGHLLAFAARDGRTGAEVVHLHGRAEKNGQITVTEADYQERYLAEDDRRSGMEDALAAAFGGSPILFLGSGIGEDDLLRPLRQFVHSSVPHSGRLAIALLPSEDEAEELERNSIRHLQRYGVYTIYYGDATVEKGRELDFFYRLHLRRKKLLDTFNDVDKKGSAKLDATDIERFKAKWNNKDKFEEVSNFKVLELEGIPIDQYPGLDIQAELSLIQAAYCFCKEVDAWPHDMSELRQLVGAYREAVKGCMDSITGAFLSARLLRIRKDWETWREEWLRLPSPQDPAAFIRTWYGEQAWPSDTTRVYRRHGVVLPEGSTKGQQDERHRFYAGAPSQTFNALLDSLREVKFSTRKTGRRIFLFIVRRGVGKGHFFAALSGPKRLLELQSVIGGNGPYPFTWPGAAFFNCSFSHEVSTTFDQLTEFLMLMCNQLFDADEAARMKVDAEPLAKFRLARLEFVLRRLGELTAAVGQAGKKRVIVAYNGISILFDADGRPKNAQAARLFELLAGEVGQAAPIDLVLVSSENTLPLPFRTEGDADKTGYGAVTTPELQRLTYKYESQRHKVVIKGRAKRLRLVETTAHGGASGPKVTPASYVHFLYGARASVMVTAFFPSVALTLALAELETMKLSSLQDCRAPLPAGLMSPGRANEIRFKIKDMLERLAGPDAKDRARLVRRLFPAMLAGAAWLTWQGCNWPEALLGMTGTLDADTLTEKVANTCNIAGRPDGVPADAATLGRLADAIDERMRALYMASGESRFGFTLLMATAYEYLLPIVDDWEGRHGRMALQGCQGFLRRMLLNLDGLAGPARTERIIARSIALHRENHATDWRLPKNIDVPASGAVLAEIQHTLLWHLAVIGQPVIAGVLARAPLIQDALKRMAVDTGKEEQTIQKLLELLELRCLIMRVRPRELKSETQARWTIHRLVQRHIFAKLHAPFIEYAEADQFSITLYASQPNDVPRLSPEAHKDLYRTVSMLIGFPEAVRDRTLNPCFPAMSDGQFDDLDEAARILELRAQILRAAFGIIRSVYSLSSISRFEPQHRPASVRPLNTSPTVRGFLEAHRLLVRWLLQQSTRHDRWCERLARCLEGKDTISRPFYAEELVWLYNECAVLSFVQGRMPEALALFDRAEAAAQRHLEPDETGPLRTRIALNRALADIERGRLPLADRALARIDATEGEHPVVTLVALGLRGLIDHIRGRLAAAQLRYKQALDGEPGSKYPIGLIAMTKSRAAALFSKYYGDLLRSIDDFKEAELRLQQGITLALEGGHEEVRHQVLLSLLRLEISKASKDNKPLDGGKLHSSLDVVDGYARSMGMPRLQAEVDQLRTELHRYGGDLKAAASVASKGLMIASANDLRLRKIAMLLRLAQIYAARELHDECEPLLTTALEMARDTDYFSAFQLGQELHARTMSRTQEL